MNEKQVECREVENKYYVESDKLRKIKREITEAKIEGFMKNILSKINDYPLQ